ncbi:hypothetical protein A3Q56_05938 [Intoshia linei]|uniref:Uncharacterized protein n=1 Tax=Intoshia linei TaxID=1819745 RepID=A0A177AWH3_9BILA|nr:hypothetical protein A3Q56_05938 [Intoshia linei]
MDKFNLPSVSGDQNMKNSKQDDLNKAHALINSNVIRNLTNSSIYPDDESKMDDHFKLDDMKNLSLPPPPTPMSNATSLPPPPTPQHNQSVHSFTQDISSQNINSIIVSEPDIMYPTPVIQ